MVIPRVFSGLLGKQLELKAGSTWDDSQTPLEFIEERKNNRERIEIKSLRWCTNGNAMCIDEQCVYSVFLFMTRCELISTELV